MPPSPIITLTTDFGTGSRYVAAMKGVILSINPGASIIDISHDVPAQDVQTGAIILAETVPWFPAGTIHVAVVDPGVGTRRRIVYACFDDQHVVAPDNGLFSRLASCRSPSKICAVEDPQFWLTPVSRTFHGRDIMAPVAARLSLGLAPEALGPTLEQLTTLAWPEVEKVANRIDGEVVEIDSFGNLITNIRAEMLSEVPRDESVSVTCDEHVTYGIFDTYGDQPPMTLVALVGSSGALELAIVEDSAATMLGVTRGTPVRVSWE